MCHYSSLRSDLDNLPLKAVLRHGSALHQLRLVLVTAQLRWRPFWICITLSSSPGPATTCGTPFTPSYRGCNAASGHQTVVCLMVKNATVAAFGTIRTIRTGLRPLPSGRRHPRSFGKTKCCASPMALTTWAAWTGAWLAAWSFRGSFPTSASGKVSSKRARFVLSLIVTCGNSLVGRLLYRHVPPCHAYGALNSRNYVAGRMGRCLLLHGARFG